MTQRSFIPGSPWLYFKLYTGHKTADDILVHTLRPYIGELYAAGAIDRHFFIRYSDPEFHLRLRLHIPDPARYGEVFTRFYNYLQPCADDGRVSKVVCDTYNREIERYGAATMELLEELFCTDSAAVAELLALLAALPVEGREQVRWQLSLVLLDDALTAFGYTLPEKVRLTGVMADNFKKEFGFTNHAFTKQINDKFRTLRKEIECGLGTRENFAAFEEVLQARRGQMAAVADRIGAVNPVRDQAPTTDDLMLSIHHMTMNRWFRSRNRLHELVIYDFLNKHYESAQAREARAVK